MSNIVKINNQGLEIKEYKGQRVVTFKDIDRLHERVEGTAGRNFRDNKQHFIQNVDYFEVTPKTFQLDEIRRFGIDSPRGGILITESGYLMLVKSLTDDLAWSVQRELVNNYFRSKELVNTLEILNNQLELMRSQIENSIDVKINEKLEELSEYYRPTHATKIDICNYIKGRLGVDASSKEYELVKQRVLLILDANKWQDVSKEILLNSIDIIDKSIEVIKATRVNNQISLFD